MKNIRLTILLADLLIVTILLLPAFADIVTGDRGKSETDTIEETQASSDAEESSIISSGNCGASVLWELDDSGCLTISGNGDMYDYGTSSDEAPWGTYNNRVLSVIVEDGVTAIGDCAFQGCRVSNIVLPAGVNRIGAGAFERCEWLEEITIPSGIATVEKNAFRICRALKTVIIPNGVTDICDSAFEGCSGLTSVYIPASVCRIGLSAFGSPNNITDVYYSGTLEQWQQIEIDDWNEKLIKATKYYSNEEIPCGHILEYHPQTEVTCSNPGLLEYWYCGICDKCFRDEEAKNLTTVEALTITKLNIHFTVNWKCTGCGQDFTITSDKVFSLPATVKIVDHEAFAGTNAEIVVLSAALISISEDAFANCENLKLIYVPEQVWNNFSEYFSTMSYEFIRFDG